MVYFVLQEIVPKNLKADNSLTKTPSYRIQIGSSSPKSRLIFKDAGGKPEKLEKRSKHMREPINNPSHKRHQARRITRTNGASVIGEVLTKALVAMYLV